MADTSTTEMIELQENNDPPPFSSYCSRQESYITQHSYGTQFSQPYRRKRGVNLLGNKWTFKDRVADFFGVGDNPEEQAKWLNRSISLASRTSVGGDVKEELRKTGTLESVFDAPDSLSLSYNSYRSQLSRFGASKMDTPTPMIIDPLHRPTRQESRISRASYIRQVSSISHGRRSNKGLPRRSRKESAVKMAYDGIKTLVTGPKASQKRPEPHSRSFTPISITQFHEGSEVARTPTIDSVFTAGDDSYLDDVFFDTALPTSPLAQPYGNSRAPLPKPLDLKNLPFQSHISHPTPVFDCYKDRADDILMPTNESLEDLENDHLSVSQRVQVTVADDDAFDECDGATPKMLLLAKPKKGWGRTVKPPSHPDTPAHLDQPDSVHPLSQHLDKLMEKALKKSSKREIGKGLIGMCFDREYKEDLEKELQQQMEDIDDHRPYFTYWITFVHIVIYLFTIASYGLAPMGFEETEIKMEVLNTHMSIEAKSYFEKDNFWLGPRQADLIHLGAKFSPCMRRDANIEKAIYRDRVQENSSACCVFNDGRGCYQSQGDCPVFIATWMKWEMITGPDSRTSGSVCGQDPRFCKMPRSNGAFEWPDDITTWPICLESMNASGVGNEHMNCELTGRPCCVGIKGECVITSQQDCAFRKGYFHEEASLCSQVNCMNEICGMFPFVDPERPDQVYRLWTCLFIHAGLGQLIVSVLFQMFIMRDLEKLAGWIRIGIIYLGSGVAGSLSSGIFLPYHVEAGPAGCHFGLLACLFVEVVQSWYLLKHPWWAIGKLSMMLFILFIIGFLPMVDNYAHVVGFVFGLLLSFAFLPYVTFGKFDRRRKIVGILVSLILASSILGVLIVLFYVSPVYECPYCHYFNCIPLTDKFCKSMEVEVVRDS